MGSRAAQHAAKDKRKKVNQELRAQRYASAGISCDVDTATGKIIAEALGMKLVCVPINDAKSRCMDRYYCEPHASPFSVPVR